MNGAEPDIIRDVEIFCLSLCEKKWTTTTTMRKQYVSAVHFVKHYTCHNKWWQTIQNVFNKHYFICLMHVCQMWTLWLVVGPRRIKNSSSLNSLVGPLPSLSPSLLPPPSLDASLRAAAARATGGGGTLVERGRAGQSPGWDPGLGLRPLPPHHCKQPPLGYTSPPRPLQMLTMTDDMSSANCVQSSAKQREQ